MSESYLFVSFDIISPILAALIVLLNLGQLGYIVKKKYFQTVKGTVFMGNLVSGNLLLGLVIIASKIVYNHVDWRTEHPLLKLLGFLKGQVTSICLHVSSFTIVCMTIEKMLAVKKPYLIRNVTKKFRVKVCLLIWLTTCGVLAGVRYGVTNPKIYYIVNYVDTTTRIMLSIPIETVCFILTLKSLKDRGQFSENEKRENKTQRKFVMLLIKTHVCFVLCWLPLCVYGTLEMINYFKEDYMLADVFNVAVYQIAFTSSILNPLIYFQHHGIFHHVLRCWKTKQPLAPKETPRNTNARAVEIKDICEPTVSSNVTLSSSVGL